MPSTVTTSDRRRLLGAGVGTLAGALATSLRPASAEAAELSAEERANVKLVNDFCAAWPSHDLAKVMAFFADTPAYRMVETVEPAKGRQAVEERIKSVIDRVQVFDVLDTFARGPIVVNERIDRFNSGTLKAWRGIGVFLVKDGKIVEWYDYTISMERA